MTAKIWNFAVFLYFYMSFIENLMKFISRTTLIVWIFLIGNFPITAQFNVKVGYNAVFLDIPQVNGMVRQYNAGLAEPLDDLDEFSSLHGLELGVRYKIGNTGFEASWNSGLGNSDVFAVINGSNFSKKYFMSLSEFALHAESYYRWFGFGAGIGYRTARIRTDIAGSRRKRQELDSSSGFTGKIFLIFQIPGDKVALAFKPYYQIPLSDLSFPGFANQLGLNPLPDVNDRFKSFGISIVLYNGKQ